jgi:predicted dehydrogenase
MAKVRIGFIGAGGMARAHVRRLADIPEAEIVALADPSSASLDEMKAEFPALASVPTFGDYRDMLAQVPMDAVEIHSPHTCHYPQALDVLQAGMHLLLEKPMVCTSQHARELIKAGANRVFMLSYQRHFQGPYRYIREQLQQGAVGDIQYIAALQSQNWLRATKGTWRQSLALSGGGQLNDSGSHLVDILLWSTGLRAKSVAAYSENHGSEVDIDSATSIRFANGAQGTLSIIGDSPMWWEEFSIWGTKGAILYRNGTVLQRGWDDTEMRTITDFPPDSTPDHNFIDAILGRASVQVPPECGLAVIELTEAIWRSAAEHRAVDIDLS